MIRSILIDDEAHCIESLTLDIQKYCPEIDIIGQSTSSKEGLKKINDLKPQLVFLDIEMPWMNGFELLEILAPIDFEVIFVTAYDSYALKAFKVSAIDYLMKPIDKDDLIKAIEKVKAKIAKGQKSNIHTLLESYFNSTKQKKVIFSEKDKQQIIDPSEIMYIKADGNYSIIHLENKKPLTISITLKAVEEKLNDEHFLRVHHSYVVNMDKVFQLVKSDGGYILMNDSTIIPISRSKKSDLQSYIQQDFK
jgi:two-component system LytT family response regulator